MATRTWNNITMPSGNLFVHFAFKVTGDGSYTVISHTDLPISITQASGNTTLVVDGVSFALGDIDAEVDFVVLLLSLSGSTLSVYVNGSTTAVTDTLTYSSTGEYDMTVGSVGLTLSNFVIGGTAIDISSYAENYIYNDIVNNSGDLFFEVA